MTGQSPDERDDDPADLEILASIAVAALAAAIAVAARASIGPRIAGEQAIFSYPAIIIVTLLAGRRAGSATALILLFLLWYFVIPHKHSFALAEARDGMALAVYAFVAAAFVFFVGKLRVTFYRYRKLAFVMERRVDELTSQRSRIWEHVPDLAIVVSRDGFIEAANPAFAKAVGTPAHLLTGISIRDLVAEEDWRRLRSIANSLARGERAVQFRMHLSAVDGPLAVSWNAALDGQMLYLIGRTGG